MWVPGIFLHTGIKGLCFLCSLLAVCRPKSQQFLSQCKDGIIPAGKSWCLEKLASDPNTLAVQSVLLPPEKQDSCPLGGSGWIITLTSNVGKNSSVAEWLRGRKLRVGKSRDFVDTSLSLQVGSWHSKVKAIWWREKRRAATDRVGQREGEAETEPQQREWNEEAENTQGACARHSSRRLSFHQRNVLRIHWFCLRGCSSLFPGERLQCFFLWKQSLDGIQLLKRWKCDPCLWMIRAAKWRRVDPDPWWGGYFSFFRSL